MNSAATEVLFDELLKNSDDLDLFLTMHYGFNAIYENLCLEFFFDCLVPRLQKKINEYNTVNSHKLKLNVCAPDKRRELLAPYGGLGISSKNAWPEKLAIFLESGSSGCRIFYAGVTMDQSKGDLGSMAGPFEQGFRESFKTVSSYKQGQKYIFCDYPSRNWDSQKMFPALVKDVLARRSSEDAQCPTADRYVEMLMALVTITDKVVKDTCSGSDLN